MVEPHSSNFRVITTKFLGVRIFRKFTVKLLFILAHSLPPIPSNLTFEERRQGKSLYIQWSLPKTQMVPGGVLYVLEHRNTTSLKPSWSHDTPWITLLLVS